MWVIKILNTYYKVNRTNISTEDNRLWVATCSEIQYKYNLTPEKKIMQYGNVFIFLVGFKVGKCVGY